jgi:hypothetical protein
VRFRHADGVEVYVFTLGRFPIVGIFVVEKVWIGRAGFGRIEKRVVPHAVSGPGAMHNVVGSALEEVAY